LGLKIYSGVRLSFLYGDSVPKNILFYGINFHPPVIKIQSKISKVARWAVFEICECRHLGLKIYSGVRRSFLYGDSVPKNILFYGRNFQPIVIKIQSEISMVARWAVFEVCECRHLGLKIYSGVRQSFLYGDSVSKNILFYGIHFHPPVIRSRARFLRLTNWPF
jgi:hypothetical protein